MAIARSSCDGTWIASRFHNMGHWAGIKHDVIFRQSSPGGGQLVFSGIHQNAALGALTRN